MSTIQVFKQTVETKLGTWLVAATEAGVSFLAFDADNAAPSFERFIARLGDDVRVEERSNEVLTEAARQLVEYGEQQRNEFNLPLDLHGTEFELAVWTELQSIPFGETRTYGELARAVGDSGAARAVGGANGRNPLPVIVPCHRVVAANGLGGFSGGEGVKERLLAHEGALLFG